MTMCCGLVRIQGRSFMWGTPFVALQKCLQPMETTFHHCRYGSARCKLTKLLHNVLTFDLKFALPKRPCPWALGPASQRPMGHQWRNRKPWNLCRSMAFHYKALGALCAAASFAKGIAGLYRDLTSTWHSSNGLGILRSVAMAQILSIAAASPRAAYSFRGGSRVHKQLKVFNAMKGSLDRTSQ